MITHAPNVIRADRFAGLFAPACIDVFAGLGGWSIGEERAFVRGGYRDRYIDLMINHWDTAVAVHQANHPMTQHLRANVLEVDPKSVLLGRPIAHAHFSPDCVDHSKAKGGRPRRKEIRALADIVIVWARDRRPSVITLENVEEFAQWGPLMQKRDQQGEWLWTKSLNARSRKKASHTIVTGPKFGTAAASKLIESLIGGGSSIEPFMIPDPTRRGDEFRRWVAELRALGYAVEHRELRACDYGAPTTRKRLYVIARCDGKPIIWPEATHGPALQATPRQHRSASRTTPVDAPSPELLLPRSNLDGLVDRNIRSGSGQDNERSTVLKPYRTAASCIDWNEPMLSIFATRAEAVRWAKSLNAGRDKHERLGIPQRPLKIKTQQRLAGGLWKHVLTAGEPFIVNIANYGWNTSQTESMDRPLSTVTAGPRGGKHAVVDVGLAAFSSTLNHGGDEHRSEDLRDPLNTVTSSRDARAVVSAEIVPFTAGVGGRAGQSAPTAVDQPLPTVTGKADRVIGATYLASPAHSKTTGRGRYFDSPSDPLKSITGVNDKAAVVAQLSPFTIPRYGEREGQSPRSRSVQEPAPTVTPTANGAQLAAAALSKHFGGVIGKSVDAPIDTVTGVDHHSLLAVHLSVYHQPKAGETRSQDPAEPIKTLDTQNRFAAVAAHVVKFRGQSIGTSLDEPLPTVTSGAGAARDAGAAHAMGLSAAYLSHMYTSNTCGGQGDVRRPLKTITSGGQHSSVCVVYLAPYYGEGSGKTGHTPAEPMPTVVGRDRFALSGVETAEHPHWVFTPKSLARAKQVASWARRMLGKKIDPFLLPVRDESGKVFHLLTLTIRNAIHLVTDVLMRMLRPRELARAQGFDDSYIIDRTADGQRVSKADQVKLIGNSVCPDVAEAIVRENVVLMGLLDESPRGQTGRRRRSSSPKAVMA